ncbi:adenylyltransferase/cytidyltransferase family protein [Escherichia coli]
MTNGVFDILHAGHVSYLANASKLGDRLISL